MKLATTMGTCNINIHLLGINHGILSPLSSPKHPTNEPRRRRKTNGPTDASPPAACANSLPVDKV